MISSDEDEEENNVKKPSTNGDGSHFIKNVNNTF